MRKLPVIIAAAGMLCALPAFAGQLESGSSPYGSDMSRGKGMSSKGTYGYEREGGMGRYGERAEAYREGCKYITVRQRRGDEIIVRHFRRCD
jgi:hypothetical protein